ncbi:hypothetical protein Tco_0485530 [Tanacetum coccineum]
MRRHDRTLVNDVMKDLIKVFLELPYMPEDPYMKAALQAPPSLDYVPGLEEPEQAPPSPDYVSKCAKAC